MLLIIPPNDLELRFQEILVNHPTSKAELEYRTKLQSLCETRWSASADYLLTFKGAYSSVVEILDDMSINYGDSKGGVHKRFVTQFGFIVSLVATEHVLSALAPLSLLLQKKTCDLLEAVREANVINEQTSNERNYSTVWEAIYDKAVVM